jgi:hypothetical protein
VKPKSSWPKRQTVGEFMALQRKMSQAIMRPLTDAGGMRQKWINGHSTKRVAEGFIKPNDRLTAFERLEIYNRQYWFRLKDCFYDDYIGLRAILGDRRFEQLASAYLARHPSQSHTLRNLGRRLVDFLEAEPRWILPQRQLALDMARLEWAHIEAFDNEARSARKFDGLSGLDLARIRLPMQPHLTLLELQNEVDHFLIELKQGTGLRAEASQARGAHSQRFTLRLKQELRSETTYVAVHRQAESVYYKRLQARQYRILMALQAGATLEAACSEVMESDPDTAGLATLIKDWFADWASLGWFCEP